MKALLIGESVCTRIPQEDFQKNVEGLIAQVGVTRVARLDAQDLTYPSVEGYRFRNGGTFSINYFDKPMHTIDDAKKGFRGRLVPLELSGSKMKLLEASLYQFILEKQD